MLEMIFSRNQSISGNLALPAGCSPAFYPYAYGCQHEKSFAGVTKFENSASCEKNKGLKNNNAVN